MYSRLKNDQEANPLRNIPPPSFELLGRAYVYLAPLAYKCNGGPQLIELVDSSGTSVGTVLVEMEVLPREDHAAPLASSDESIGTQLSWSVSVYEASVSIATFNLEQVEVRCSMLSLNAGDDTSRVVSLNSIYDEDEQPLVRTISAKSIGDIEPASKGCVRITFDFQMTLKIGKISANTLEYLRKDALTIEVRGRPEDFEPHRFPDPPPRRQLVSQLLNDLNRARTRRLDVAIQQQQQQMQRLAENLVGRSGSTTNKPLTENRLMAEMRILSAKGGAQDRSDGHDDAMMKKLVDEYSEKLRRAEGELREANDKIAALEDQTPLTPSPKESTSRAWQSTSPMTEQDEQESKSLADDNKKTFDRLDATLKKSQERLYSKISALQRCEREVVTNSGAHVRAHPS